MKHLRDIPPVFVFSFAEWFGLIGRARVVPLSNKILDVPFYHCSWLVSEDLNIFDA